MKTIDRFFFSILFLTLYVAAGCDSQATGEEAALRSAVALMLEEGWSKGEVSVFEETVADSVRFHYAGNSPRILSREEMSRIVLRWREAFPDLRMRLDELLVKGNRAAARMTLTGTHRGSWAGADSTGNEVRMALMMFFHFEDGKMVELWESDDQLGFRRQLGLIPPAE